MPQKLPDIVQTDFSGGQINYALKRRDKLEFVKTGARTMRNWRIEAGGTLIQRPAKHPLFAAPGTRTEYVRMGQGVEFLINFSAGAVTIFNLDGTASASYASAAYLWGDVSQIDFAVALFDIVLTYPGMPPQVLRWDPYYLTWTFLPYTFRTIYHQVQEPFYRFSALGATMAYDGYTGNVLLTCSTAYFHDGMVGTRLSIVGQQVTITAILSPTQARADVAYRLPDNFNVSVNDPRPFMPGQIVQMRDQNFKAEVGVVGGNSGFVWMDWGAVPLNEMIGVMLSDLVCDFAQFSFSPVSATTDALVSELGSSTMLGPPFARVAGAGTVQWTEEFMCQLRGWPARCAYTAGRLCFFGFPQMPEAILWSAIAADDICWVDPVAATRQPEAGAQPDAAILEFESSRARIVSVVEWGDIFVFSDRGIFYIPVSQADPLAPGNVQFKRFSNDGVSSIRPVSTQDAIVYINQGLNRCSIVRATGALTRPYISDDVSESHAQLFTSPVSLSIATGDGPYPERYVYCVNSDGRIAVGKFTQERKLIGWVPWTSPVQTTWVTNAGPKVWFTTAYPGANLVEIEDALAYLDGMQFINAPDLGMVNAAIPGPLWHLAGMTVQVVDGQGVAPTRDDIPNGIVDYGDRVVDANGYLITRPTDMLWLDSPTVYAGIWNAPVYEPFLFPPPETSAPGVRGKRRGLQRAVISVEHSNGFTFGRTTIPPVDYGEDPLAAPQDPPFPLPDGSDDHRDWRP